MVAVDPAVDVHVVVPLNSSPGTPALLQAPLYVISGLRSSRLVTVIPIGNKTTRLTG